MMTILEERGVNLAELPSGARPVPFGDEPTPFVARVQMRMPGELIARVGERTPERCVLAKEMVAAPIDFPKLPVGAQEPRRAKAEASEGLSDSGRNLDSGPG
jgi:hypothetical protein